MKKSKTNKRNTIQREIILIRHPEATHNKDDVLGGWSDTELTKTGEKQLKEIVDKMKDEKIDVIYTSDLKRCYLLADQLSKKLNCPLIVTPKLRERFYGSAEGKRVDKLPNDVESLEDLEKRVIEFINDIDLERAVLVTHGGPIKIIVKRIKGEEIVPKNIEIINITFTESL